MDRFGVLYSLGHWCSSRHGRFGDLLPAPYRTQATCREVIVFVFVPLGPLGQGGFGIMQSGKVAFQVFPKTHTFYLVAGNAGAILYVMGWLIALIMWGFGIVWLFFALASISRSKFPFNMGWLGFTFPLGVFTVSTTTKGEEIPSKFFDVLGTVRNPIRSAFLREIRPRCMQPRVHRDLDYDENNA